MGREVIARTKVGRPIVKRDTPKSKLQPSILPKRFKNGGKIKSK